MSSTATVGTGVAFAGGAQKLASRRRETATEGDATGFPRGVMIDRFFFSRDEANVIWRNPDGSQYLPWLDREGNYSLETAAVGSYAEPDPAANFELRVHRYPVLRPGRAEDDPALRPVLPEGVASRLDPFPTQLLWRFGRTADPPADYWRPLDFTAPEIITFRRTHVFSPQSEIYPFPAPVRTDRLRLLGPGGDSYGAPHSDLSAFSVHMVPYLIPDVEAVTALYVVDFASGQWAGASHVAVIAYDDPGTSPHPDVNGLVEVQVIKGYGES